MQLTISLLVNIQNDVDPTSDPSSVDCPYKVTVCVEFDYFQQQVSADTANFCLLEGWSISEK